MMFRGPMLTRHDFTDELSRTISNSLDCCAIPREARKLLKELSGFSDDWQGREVGDFRFSQDTVFGRYPALHANQGTAKDALKTASGGNACVAFRTAALETKKP
jgi:hypothetical protein